MIPLRISVDPLPIDAPIITRIRMSAERDALSDLGRDAVFIGQDEGVSEFDLSGLSLRLRTVDVEKLDGDIVMIVPGQTSLHRLIRKTSTHNTFLVTEQCDQLCVMCSQPPKKYHVDLFDQFFEAVELAPSNIVIGLSGGEPMLHKQRLFDFLKMSITARPDLKFHILTNGQHFKNEDADFLKSLPRGAVLWGIPMYACDEDVHDQIVVKQGAFIKLCEGLALLASTGADIELRTVVMNSNILHLPALARFIATRLPFINFWAIMQMESIGFGRMNWDKEFFDNSVSFDKLSDAINLSAALGTDVALYNFPLCTLPDRYRQFSVNSISDWKQKYLSECAGCTLMVKCGGFFEWYQEGKGFKEVKSQ